MSTLNIDGLVTGIDTESIINGMTAFQQRAIQRSQDRAAEITAMKTAFAGVETRLLGLRSAAGRLSRAQNSVFDQRSVTSSDESILTANAASGTTPGVYSLQVTSLAKAHQIASQAFDSTQSSVGSGTFTLRVGSGAETEITVDSSNNTVQGLADTINQSGAEVTASVINDGNGFRLMLTANETGAPNTISVTNGLTGGTTPDFTGDSVQEAQNAAVVLGNGPGAITIESESNTMRDVLPGITLNLQNVDAEKTVTLNVQTDFESAETAVTEFVDGFNNLMEYVDNQVRYVPEADQAGILTGNYDVIGIQNTVRNAINEVIGGLGTDANRLSAIGIDVTDNGHLELDTSELKKILEGRHEDVSIDELRDLFAIGGSSNDDGFTFIAASSNSNLDNTDVEIDITQAATHAALTAGSDLAASTVIDSANDTLVLEIDGFTSSELVLAHGTYTQSELAAELQSVINANGDLNDHQVNVSVDANRLVIQSDAWGSASEVEVISGTALTDLGLSAGSLAKGTDVIGSFIVNGVAEQAEGRGQLLIGDSDNETTADLQVRVTIPPDEVVSGAESTLTVTTGVAARLDRILEGILDPVTGRIQTINDRFDTQVADIQTSIERQNEVFETRRDALLLEFSALESQVSQLQNTGAFLTQQLG